MGVFDRELVNLFLDKPDVHPSHHSVAFPSYAHHMPWGLKRFQQAQCLHFIAFSCYLRAPLLSTQQNRLVFAQTLERVRKWYGFYVTGYVVTPEHVHLLISEPEPNKLSVAIQMLKQNVAQQLKQRPPCLSKERRDEDGAPSGS